MDEKQFTELYNKHSQTLFGRAMTLTRDIVKAKDLSQETWLRIYKNREKFEMGSNFEAWSTTILKNVFISGFRRQKTRPQLSNKEENTFGRINHPESYDNINSVLAAEFIEDIINNLRPTSAEPLKLFIEGYSYEEIAEKVGIPFGTVKSKIFYARKELFKKLEEHYQGYWQTATYGNKYNNPKKLEEYKEVLTNE